MPVSVVMTHFLCEEDSNTWYKHHTPFVPDQLHHLSTCYPDWRIIQFLYQHVSQIGHYELRQQRPHDTPLSEPAPEQSFATNTVTPHLWYHRSTGVTDNDRTTAPPPEYPDTGCVSSSGLHTVSRRCNFRECCLFKMKIHGRYRGPTSVLIVWATWHSVGWTCNDGIVASLW